MDQDKLFFSPNNVDKQVDQLLQHSNRSSSNSQSQLDIPSSRVVRQLQSIYPMFVKDEQALQRVWQRLVRSQRMSYLRTDGNAQAEQINERVNTQETKQERSRSLIRESVPGFRARKPILQHFGILAAVLYLTLLVGSMVVVFNTAHQNQSKPGSHPKPASTVRAPHVAPLVPNQAALYVSMMDGFYRLDPRSGKTLWHYKIDPSLGGGGGNSNGITLTVIQTTAYFGGRDAGGYYLGALDTENGSLRWRFHTKWGLMSIPQVVNGIVYSDASDGLATGSTLYALDAVDGSLRWSRHYSDALAISAVINGVIYVNEFFHVAALSARDGSLLWQASSLYQDTISGLQLVNNMLYATSYTNVSFVSYVYAFNPATGHVLWSEKLDNGGLSDPVVSNSVIYLGSQIGYFYALNVKDGSVRWMYHTQGSMNTTPVVTNAKVYIGKSCTGVNVPCLAYIIALATSNGNVAWSHALDNYSGLTPLAANGKVLYASSGEGIIHVLNMSDGAEVQRYQVGNSMNGFTPSVTVVQ